MIFKDFICKGVLVFTGLLLIGWLGQYIYMVNGEIDWFRLILVYGVPVEYRICLLLFHGTGIYPVFLEWLPCA